MTTPAHATAVARDGWAVLLLGPPGSGKSDLALRLLDRGWRLVADDYVVLNADGGVLRASPPAAIAGKLEVRGIGIVEVAHAPGAAVALAVDLVAMPERLPEPALRRFQGVAVAVVALDPFAASACLKLELAFTHAKAALMAGSQP